MKTLIVVDVQNDFICPTWGHLYVPNGEEVVQAICDYINENVDDLREVIFTLDWHPNIDSVFTEPNIKWPTHCIQFSEGAAIPQQLINTCIENNLSMKFFLKGNDDIYDASHTEYGAFENIVNKYSVFNNVSYFKVNNRVGNSQLWISEDDDLIICGVAGDYCVMNTIKNLQKYTNKKLNIIPYLAGIRSIDGGETFDNFIKENNLTTV